MRLRSLLIVLTFSSIGAFLFGIRDGEILESGAVPPAVTSQRVVYDPMMPHRNGRRGITTRLLNINEEAWQQFSIPALQTVDGTPVLSGEICRALAITDEEKNELNLVIERIAEAIATFDVKSIHESQESGMGNPPIRPDVRDETFVFTIPAMTNADQESIVSSLKGDIDSILGFRRSSFL